jgi:hypothetical protein
VSFTYKDAAARAMNQKKARITIWIISKRRATIAILFFWAEPMVPITIPKRLTIGHVTHKPTNVSRLILAIQGKNLSQMSLRTMIRGICYQ